jgi:hypothetical protein
MCGKSTTDSVTFSVGNVEMVEGDAVVIAMGPWSVRRGTSTSHHSRPGACRRLIQRVCAASQRYACHPPIEPNRRRMIEGSVWHLQGS